jgi:cytochrome P450
MTEASGFRSYEIHQRQRPGQTTELIKPRQLASVDYLNDPYPIVAILRENYPCYRDWPGNAYWITRYDDVTSVFVDDANYQTRSKLWFYDRLGFGNDLTNNDAVTTCIAHKLDEAMEPVARRIVAELEHETDLATEFAARYPIELWASVLGLPFEDVPLFAQRWWRMQRGYLWNPAHQADGRAAMDELVAYIRPRLATPNGNDLVSVVAGLDSTAEDLVVTLLESDHETLHGSLANMWFQLLTNREQYDIVRNDRRMVKFALFETLRHSAPVVAAKRFTRHEVERFGRLLPEGALVMCSAAAANRDPRIFTDPDVFNAARKDLCQREPRGMYRADGLPAGISFGTGKPSKHPAVPEDRPRSTYAFTRDCAITATQVLLDERPGLQLTPYAAPRLRALGVGEMHTCWHLPVIG